MAQRCDILYRLQHDGTSQTQRALAALNPAYVKVDERDIEDFLVFALRFANSEKAEEFKAKYEEHQKEMEKLLAGEDKPDEGGEAADAAAALDKLKTSDE